MTWPTRKRTQPPFKPVSFIPQSTEWWVEQRECAWTVKYERVQSEVRRLFTALEDTQFTPLSTTNVADMVCPDASRALRTHLIKIISASYQQLAEYRRASDRSNNRGKIWVWHCPYYWVAEQETDEI